jgi:iron complex outermembrane recepter protein
MTTVSRIVHAVLAGASAGVLASTAVAQTAPGASGIEEIVVTAQRREERLQDVPIAISAFSQELLTRTDTRDMSRLEQFTPGFSFGQSGFDTRPGIRGVRTDAVDGNGDTTIGYYVDDVYQSLAVQASQPFVDVARVEIARGPQGTLFGRNTFGGAISVINALPGDAVEGGVDLTLGNYERRQAQGFFSAPLGETFGVRLAGLYEDRDPFVNNVVVPGNDIYDRETRYVRGTARWTPSERVEVVLRGTYWKEGGTGAGAYGYKQGGLLVNPATGLGSLTGTPLYFYTALRDGVPDLGGFDVGQQTSTDPYEWESSFTPRARLTSKSANLQARWSNDAIFLRSITSYVDFKYLSNTGEALGSPDTEYLQDRNTETFTQELQIGSVEDRPLQWVAGLYFYRDRYFDQFSLTSPGYDFFAPNNLSTDSYAGYAQFSYYLNERVRVTAGGRYTVDDKGIDSSSFDTFADYGTAVDDDEFKKFTWRAGVDFFVRPENMLYASVSTGFRSGGFNVAALTVPNLSPTFEVEEVTAYEIGSKNRFADGTLQLNASAFFNDFENLQIQSQFPLPAPSTSVISAVLNAGAAEAYGLEVESIWAPTPALTLNATAALIEAEFTDFGYFGRPSRFYPNQQQDLSGNRIPRTPKFKFTVGAAYDFVLPGVGTITPQANATVSAEYYNTDYNTLIDRQGGYTLIDASLTWKSEDGRYSVQAFGTNLTDKPVLNYGAFGSQTLLTSYAPPRFYGIRASFRAR